MRAFQYPCPECRSTSNIHDEDCAYSSRDREEIEVAYFDILSTLSFGSKVDIDAEDVGDAEPLQDAVDGSWTGLYADCLNRLRVACLVKKEGDWYRLLSREERKEQVSQPTMEPIKTVAEWGSVKGCHDNAVFAMIAWYEMVGLTWEETREKVIEWLRETGAWERGGFAERSPEELIEKKRHVYEMGYGWKDKAESAKRTIERDLDGT